MKPETLETLLLDRALGELTPEVAELLELHLAQNPEAALQAGRLAATVGQARRAVVVKAVVPRPPLAIERLRRAWAAQQRRAFAWEAAKLAACMALGLTLGWYVRAERQTRPIATAPAAAVEVAPDRNETARPRPGDATQDFWSLARLEAAQQERPPAESPTSSRYRLRWDSPTKMPHVEENL